MPTGTDYKNDVAGKSGLDREKVTLAYFAAGAMPSFSTRTVPVEIEETIGGEKRRLILDVAPDFFSLGSDVDPFYAPMWPTTAQTIADSLQAILPSVKLAKQIYKAAPVKISLYDVNPGEPWYDMKTGTPRKIEDSGAWAASNPKKVALTRLALKGAPPGSVLVAGHSKDLVTEPNSSGKRVRIYGGGGGKVDGWAVQPPSTIHDWNYGPDYSHGVRFIRRAARLDGQPVDLVDLFQDPVLSALVSDEGAYVPRVAQPPATKGSPANEEKRTPLPSLDLAASARRDATGDYLFLGVVGLGLVLAARTKP